MLNDFLIEVSADNFSPTRKINSAFSKIPWERFQRSKTVVIISISLSAEHGLMKKTTLCFDYGKLFYKNLFK
jgi:hypothetical protein